MAVLLRLPDPEGLPPVVLFHRKHPTNPVVILQVPSPGATDAETYRLRLDKPADLCWIERLKNGKEIIHQLTMEQHLRYEPGTGSWMALPDLDAPAPFVEDIRRAEQTAAPREPRTPGRFTRAKAALMSPIRRILLAGRVQ